MKYTDGFRGSIIKKVLHGGGKSAWQVAQETGVNVTTIQNWLRKHKAGSLVLDGSEGGQTPGQRSPTEKLALLMESRGLDETRRGEWLRQNGLHSEHLPLWEQELTNMMNDKQTDLTTENSVLKKRNKELEKELARKDKALAEAAVLLTLKKNFQHLFQEDGES